MRLDAAAATDAAQALAAVDPEPLPPGQVVEGTPTTRFLDLDETGDRVVGVWEHTPGVSTDIEADEVFVVLAGRGTLAFAEPALATVDLHPGVIVRLEKGMRTTWTIHETLRKVYLAP